jgi:signal transduction histidine kinase
MSFRARLFLAFSLAVLVPLGLLAFGVRREMERRLTAEYQRRVAGGIESVRADLDRESGDVAARIAALAAELAGENRFRLAVIQNDPQARRYLLDWAGNAMRLSGLSMLQLQDSSGRILSSGHFRNEYDRVEPALPRLLATTGAVALARVRTPEAPLIALARVDSLRVAGSRFSLAGGTAVGDRLLRRLTTDPDLTVTLVIPGQAATGRSRAEVVGELPVSYLDVTPGAPARVDTVRLVVTQSAGTLVALRRSIDAWFLVALAATVGLALAGAAWLSSRISRPLSQLAEKTSAIDLDRLDQDFSSDRGDEIGALSRLLGAMTDRLRIGAGRLREAERRIAMGDLARQVNHDIKNGLIPIRNVLRHITQVAEERPETLKAVLEERRGTLDSGITYLENLARNYARLSPALTRESCQVNAVVDEVIRAVPPGRATLHGVLAERLPPVLADRLVLRRILENLVGNAVESLAAGPPGTVTVSSEAIAGDGRGTRVRVTVADTGPGMSRAQLDRAFDDFYTTKEGGTGLGLSIVKRLVLDLEGTLRVDTEPGAGTRVVVELPALTDGADTG